MDPASFSRITFDPSRMNGQACVRGMRLTVHRVVAAVASYPDREDLFRNYPDLDEEDLRQALEFAVGSATQNRVTRHTLPVGG